MAKIKEVFAFGYQVGQDDKYKLKMVFDKKKAFNLFYRSKKKYLRCGVFLCKALNDYKLLKYAECGFEVDPAKAEREQLLCVSLL